MGAIAEIVAMTDRVIEIRLRSPRPNFLQLLAQPEMGIIRAGQGTGSFHRRPCPRRRGDPAPASIGRSGRTGERA
jgi:hypothetical protein